jgi:hypothetical protein
MSAKKIRLEYKIFALAFAIIAVTGLVTGSSAISAIGVLGASISILLGIATSGPVA